MNVQKSTEVEKIRESGRLSVRDGFFTGIMNGFGDRYVSAYAIFLGGSNFLIALLSTLPALFGNFSQIYSIGLMRRFPRKRIVVFNSFIQALLWLPILLTGVLYYYFESIRIFSPILLLVVYSSLVIVGSISGPVWNSWMRDLVAVNKGRYFGMRNQTVNIAIVCSMLIAGSILNFFSATYAVVGFLIIFSIACISRLIAVSYLFRQYEPKFVYDENAYFGFREFVSRMFFNNFGKFVIFVSLISFATAIAGPFFVVYQLKELGLSYFSFTLISLSAIITTIIFLPFWGIFSDKFGNVWVLKFTSLLIPLVPILWIFSFFVRSHFVFLLCYLILVEFFSGFVWGGFNLSASNFIYDAVSRERMAICVAYFNFINAFLAFVGSLVGTLLTFLDFGVGIVGGFLFIFLISGIVRFVVVILMHSRIREVRDVKDFHLRAHIREQLLRGGGVLWRYIGFKPIRINSNL